MTSTPVRSLPTPAPKPRVGLLFDFDWDALAHAAHGDDFRWSRAGFDLFSFPSNVGLVGFDMDRWARRLADRARREAWAGVLSHHEQFGALLAALVAERAGLPGASVASVAACQHKLHARHVLQRVAPESCPAFAPLEAVYGGPIPEGLAYPAFVKPVKAAFSVLARRVDSHGELHRFTRFGRRELWVIRRLVEPFERVARRALPASAGTAHRMLLEQPVHAAQYNLDGWVRDGQLQVLGVVDAHVYPGTQAFMRFELPSRLPASVQARAADVARRFLQAVGYGHGFFNMEFFHDPATDRLTVIEFNPRLASQFGDLYRRVLGLDAHRMALNLACDLDVMTGARTAALGGAAASLVYRAFEGEPVPPQPSAGQLSAFRHAEPTALFFGMPKTGHGLQRDFKWLGSHRYGIVHLHGRDAADLRHRAQASSQRLGWPVPYALQDASLEPASLPLRHCA
jgi:biotin carboxylase